MFCWRHTASKLSSSWDHLCSSVPPANQKSQAEEHEKLPCHSSESEEAVGCGRARTPAWIKTECLSNWEQDSNREAGSLHPAASEACELLSQHRALELVVCLGCVSGWRSTCVSLNLLDPFFSAYSESKSPCYLSFDFCDWLLQQGYPLPHLPTDFGEQKRIASLHCP